MSSISYEHAARAHVLPSINAINTSFLLRPTQSITIKKFILKRDRREALHRRYTSWLLGLHRSDKFLPDLLLRALTIITGHPRLDPITITTLSACYRPDNRYTRLHLLFDFASREVLSMRVLFCQRGMQNCAASFFCGAGDRGVDHGLHCA